MSCVCVHHSPSSHHTHTPLPPIHVLTNGRAGGGGGREPHAQVTRRPPHARRRPAPPGPSAATALPWSLNLSTIFIHRLKPPLPPGHPSIKHNRKRPAPSASRARPPSRAPPSSTCSCTPSSPRSSPTGTTSPVRGWEDQRRPFPMTVSDSGWTSGFHRSVASFNTTVTDSLPFPPVRYCNGHQGAFGWDATGASNEAELRMLLETLGTCALYFTHTLTSPPPHSCLLQHPFNPSVHTSLHLHSHPFPIPRSYPPPPLPALPFHTFIPHSTPRPPWQ